MNPNCTATELLDDLAGQGVKLWVEGAQLRYRAPKHVVTPTVIAALKERKPEIIELLQKRADPRQPFPLTHGQRALWFLQQLAPENAAYNIVCALRLQPDVDLLLLRRAVAELAQRHPVLRTTYTTQNGEPMQQMHATLDLPWAETVVGERATEETVQQWLAEEADRPFDLQHAPAMRVHLLRHAAATANPETILIATVHHIGFDFMSLEILIDELCTIYHARSTNETPRLSPLALHYRDHVEHEATRLAGPAGEQLWQYWQQTLAGDLPLLDLPADRPRSVVQQYRGVGHPVALPVPLGRQIRDLAQTLGVTPFVVMHTAFQILLGRYTGQKEILIGTPMAGRTRPELHNLVGYFANPIVLRANLSGNPSFRQLCHQVQRTVVAALDHQAYPFPLLVDRLQIARDAGRSPLFQVSFVWDRSQRSQGLAGTTTAQQSLIAEFLLAEQRGSAFDLTLNVVDSGDRATSEQHSGDRATSKQHSGDRAADTQISGELRGNADLFTPKTLARMAEQYTTLLTAIVADPTAHIADLPLLSAGETRQLLVTWNATKVATPQAERLHLPFEAQVARTPDALALRFNDQQLTYRELNERANQLAHYLQSLGVGPESLVGIYMERSLEMVIALLGVLKAGGGYVPLDPGYPAERLAFMIDDANISVLLTHARVELPVPVGSEFSFTPELSFVDLPENHPDSPLPTSTCMSCDQLQAGMSEQPYVIRNLNADWPLIDGHSRANPTTSVQRENVAYLIYTSGSTGQPKGVMVSHGAICNHMHWMNRTFPLAPTDRVLQKTPFSFDASVWEFYAPLWSGAQLIMAQPGGHADVLYLRETIIKQGITTLQLVPSLLRLLLSQDRLRACTSLQRLFCGGEPLTPDLRDHFFEQLPNATLTNLYGPTEATVEIAAWHGDRQSTGHAVPIGRPIDNTQLYVLDQQMRPVPAGVPGELYIGGSNLARGYHRRPALTAERFVPDPFGAEPGTRLYKTGDLVRYLTTEEYAEGSIEFLGRLDNQCKLHGFRIELGEIESTLEAHPAVQQAVVVCQQDETDRLRLVAYTLFANQDASQQDPSQQGHEPVQAELRAFLKQRLPDYMVPAHFVSLTALPHLSNGKVDRRSLPMPSWSEPDREVQTAAPRTTTEERLVAIWQQLLGRTDIGIHDNFFTLGGDSIQAIQMVALASEAAIHLAPKDLFQHQTIAELAAVANSTPQIEAEQGLVTGPVPLTPIQQRFLSQQQSDHHHWNQALWVDVASHLDPEWLRTAVDHLVAHHDALRLTYRHTEGGWQGYNAELAHSPCFCFKDVSRLSAAEAQASMQATEARLQTDFDLALGPLLRIALFERGADQPQRLLLIVHHLAVDGVSWRILLEDLERIYCQLAAGETVHLPRKTTSFREWATRLQAYAQSVAMETEAIYWLASPAAPEPLPIDLPGTDNTEATAAHVECSLTRDETQQLIHTLPQSTHFGLNDLLLTALVQTIRSWSGSHQVLVDLESHGRVPLFDDLDLSRTVGWFTNLYPVLFSIGRADDNVTDLSRVSTQLDQIANEGIGHGLLRYLCQEAQIVDALAAQPQAEISFNYLGQTDGNLAASALWQRVSIVDGTSRSPQAVRPHMIEVNCWVAQNQLVVRWGYSQSLHHRTTLQTVAEQYMQYLRSLLVYGTQSATAAAELAIDLDVTLNADELDDLLLELSELETNV